MTDSQLNQSIGLVDQGMVPDEFDSLADPEYQPAPATGTVATNASAARASVASGYSSSIRASGVQSQSIRASGVQSQSLYGARSSAIDPLYGARSSTISPQQQQDNRGVSFVGANGMQNNNFDDQPDTRNVMSSSYTQGPPPTSAARDAEKGGLFQMRNILIVTVIAFLAATGVAIYFGLESSKSTTRTDGSSNNGTVPDFGAPSTTPSTTAPQCCSLDGTTCTTNVNCNQNSCGATATSTECSTGLLITDPSYSQCCSFDNTTCTTNPSCGAFEYSCGFSSITPECSSGSLIYTQSNTTSTGGSILDTFYPGENLTDTPLGEIGSDQQNAINWINLNLETDTAASRLDDPQTRFALANLYFSTNGQSWTNNNNWLTVNSICIWFGITCNSDQTNVVGIALTNNNLIGTISPEFLKGMGLQGLLSLNLGVNLLGGTIPSDGLQDLTQLQTFSLFNNSLTGNIPYEIQNLVSVQNLDLNNNRLIGTLPPSIGRLGSLQRLNIHSNYLSGSLPSQIGLLMNMTQLYLTGNKFNSFLPTEIGQLRSLRELYLDQNGFSGPLPATFGNINSLVDVRLYKNFFQGNLPTGLGNLRNLVLLYLDQNMFWGTIPSQLQGLQNLQQLSLFSNQLTGTLPSELGYLSQLQVLSLHSNSLKGTIPSSLSQVTQLNYIDLASNNAMSGTVPLGLCSGVQSGTRTLIVPCTVQGCYTQCA